MDEDTDPRINRTTLSGKLPETLSSPAPAGLKENGQHKDYWILNDEERAKGFIRPLRKTYIHVGKNPAMRGHVLIAPDNACGMRTTMNSREIVETYARDPKFYGGTFCCGCGRHLPVEEFVWEGTTERVGS